MPRIKELAVRIARRADALRKPGSRAKNVILSLAVIVLLVGIFVSVNQNPGLLRDVDWSKVWAIAVIGVPVTILLIVVEFIVMGRMAGRSIGWRKALEVTVIGSAANMLPLPGSTIVRVAALKVEGVGYKLGATITLLVSLAWIGAAFAFAGAMMAVYSSPVMGAVITLLGIMVLLVFFLVLRQFGVALSGMSWLIVTKFFLVLIDAIRIYWCFLALGVSLAFWQASAFVISSVLGSAASIVPAGIGIRELLSSGIAPIVGLSATAGFLTATLNRVVGLVILLPIAGVLAMREKRGQKA